MPRLSRIAIFHLICSCLAATMVLAGPDPPPPPPPPPEITPLPTVTPLRQTDPKWSKVKIDHSQDTIGNQGCTLTSYAMFFSSEAKRLLLVDNNGDFLSWTPESLNRLLNNNNQHYTQPDGSMWDAWHRELDPKTGKLIDPNAVSDGFLDQALLDALNEDVKQRTGNPDASLVIDNFYGVQGQTTIGAEEAPIRQALQEGRPVVIRIGNNGHTVLIFGYDPVYGWIIVDPEDKKSLLPSSEAIWWWESHVMRNGGTPAGPNYGIKYWDAEIPEPAGLLALGTGIIGLLFRMRRK